MTTDSCWTISWLVCCRRSRTTAGKTSSLMTTSTPWRRSTMTSCISPPSDTSTNDTRTGLSGDAKHLNNATHLIIAGWMLQWIETKKLVQKYIISLQPIINFRQKYRSIVSIAFS